MEAYGSEHNFMQLSSIFETHWIIEPEVSFFSAFDGLIDLSYFNLKVKLYIYYSHTCNIFSCVLTTHLILKY